jgi:hypothetical protein
MSHTFTADADLPKTVSAKLLATSGHRQLIVRCPQCRELHRHLGLGVRKAPCGCVYVVRVRRDIRAAA